MEGSLNFLVHLVITSWIACCSSQQWQYLRGSQFFQDFAPTRYDCLR